MDIPVEFGKPVHIFPYLSVAGMENMGAVFVDLDTLDFFCVDVSRYMAALFNNEASFPGFFELMCKNRPYEPATIRKSYLAFIEAILRNKCV